MFTAHVDNILFAAMIVSDIFVPNRAVFAPGQTGSEPAQIEQES
jgi:hypothetical protein